MGDDALDLLGEFDINPNVVRVDLPTDFWKKVSNARVAQGLQRDALAAILQMDIHLLIRIERNRVRPKELTLVEIYKLCDELGIDYPINLITKEHLKHEWYSQNRHQISILQYPKHLIKHNCGSLLGYLLFAPTGVIVSMSIATFRHQAFELQRIADSSHPLPYRCLSLEQPYVDHIFECICGEVCNERKLAKDVFAQLLSVSLQDVVFLERHFSDFDINSYEFAVEKFNDGNIYVPSRQQNESKHDDWESSF